MAEGPKGVALMGRGVAEGPKGVALMGDDGGEDAAGGRWAAARRMRRCSRARCVLSAEVGNAVCWMLTVGRSVLIAVC